MRTKLNHFRRAQLLVLAVLSVVIGFSVRAAAPAPAAPPAAKPSAVTNAPPVVPVKSVFESSVKDLKEYKDPFFPYSVRVHPPPPVATPVVNPGEPVKPKELPKKKSFLSLSGLTRRVALISAQGRTFEFGAGDSDVIPTPGGDAKVKCKKINKNSVVIMVDDEEVELKLGSDVGN